MKLGIIGAMDEEIAYLLTKMTSKKTREIANVVFYEGKIGSRNIVLLKSGIGKVNAAMATTILLEQYQPTVVINTGSAGGVSQDLEVGDVVISKNVVYHDVDVTAFDYQFGQVPQMPAMYEADTELIEKTIQGLTSLNVNSKIGLISTSDSFMADPIAIKKVHKQFPDLLASEMEGAAIAQVCYQYNVPFVIIRAISDIVGKDSPLSFDKFLEIAAKNAADLILYLIEEY